MRTFNDLDGNAWVATAWEESTPRHHGRWYLVIKPARDEKPSYAVPDVRWQSRVSAERTLRTMAEWELQRRLLWAQDRATSDAGIALEDTQPQPLVRGTSGRLGLPGAG